MWVTKLIKFAIGSGLAAAAWKALDARRQRSREQRQQQADRERLRQWEDEGGALAPSRDAR